VIAPLDARVAELAVEPGRTWGVRDAVLAVLAVPGSLLLTALPQVPTAAGVAVARRCSAALGILMARSGVSAAEAFDALLLASTQQGVPLPEVAARMVQDGPEPDPVRTPRLLAEPAAARRPGMTAPAGPGAGPCRGVGERPAAPSGSATGWARARSAVRR